MKTRVQKWGNSLAVRIPKVLAREACLDEHASLDLTLVDGRIVLTLLPSSVPTLEELLAGVTEENRHGEFDTGPAVGHEVW